MYYCPLVQTISAAVVEAILPTLKEMKTELNNLNELYNDLTVTVSNLEESVSGLNETVRNLEETVNSHETQIAADLGQLCMKLTSVNDSMRKELKTMESALKDHMTSELVEVVDNLEIIDLKVELLDIKQERHESRLMLGYSELEHNVLTNVTKELKKTHSYGPVISVNTTCREELKVIETLLEEHKNQTTSELADLNTSLLTFIDNHSIDIVRDAVLHKVWPYLINIEDNLSERINESTKRLVGEFQDGLSSLNESITDCRVNPIVNQTTPDRQVSKQLSDIQDGLSDLREKVCNVSDSQRELAQDMNESINSHMKHLNSKLISLNYTVISSEYELLEYLDVIDSKLDAVNDILRQEHSDIRYDIEEHKNHVNSELIELENNQDDIDTKLDSLDTKQDELSMQVMSVSSELQGTKNMLIELFINGTCLGSPSDPAHPVPDPVTNLPPPVTTPPPPVTTPPPPVATPPPPVTTPPPPVATPPPSVTTPLSPGYTCGGEGGWRRLVYFDMRDPNTTCPTGWRLTPHSKRTCGKVNIRFLACDSVFFPVTGRHYNRVCGTIRAYQDGFTDAFEAYDNGRVTTIDGAYVAGVRLTHGNPRQHIWTFAAGIHEDAPSRDDSCPCDATITIDIPPFVGQDYFCESGVNSGSNSGFHPDDPLWDGEGCSNTSTCCELNNPPYFIKQLSSPTTDDIEARICTYDSIDDIPIEYIELYVM